MSILNKSYKMIMNYMHFFNPTRAIALGFFLIIILGAILLTLPFASRDNQSISLIDALFTATSATCVTGLVVYDTYTQFSLFGQLVILSLIQIGGIGFMTTATIFSLAFRRSISLRERLLMAESVNSYGIEGIVRMTKHVIFGTLIFEGCGALLLSLKFIGEFGFFEGVYNGIFHSVSSFCNAGFDLMGKKEPFSSLTFYQSDITVNLVICLLIVIGGLGFIVWEDLLTKKKISRCKTHTKLVLTITAFLLFSGFILFLAFEWNNPATLGNLSFKDKLIASMFQSVTARTAGYNTVDQNALTVPSKFLTVIFMFIGGSPGSTAGGIKTVTFGVMVLSIISGLRGQDYIQVFRRKLTAGTIIRAISIFLLASVVIIIATMILSVSEGFGFLETLFEVVSGFATVGLTTGITWDLSNFGKLILVATMYIGRVGVTTVFLSLLLKRTRTVARYSYPEDRIVIG